MEMEGVCSLLHQLVVVDPIDIERDKISTKIWWNTGVILVWTPTHPDAFLYSAQYLL